MNSIKNEYQSVGKLFVSKILYSFVNKELLKNTKINNNLNFLNFIYIIIYISKKFINYALYFYIHNSAIRGLKSVVHIPKYMNKFRQG